MVTKEKGKKILDLYEQGYSTSYIAKELNTYPNYVNRYLRKCGKEIRTRSEAQKRSLAMGVSEHPTKGRKRTEDEKSKIKEGMVDYWDNIPEEEYEKRLDKSREVWDQKTDEEKAEMRTLAAKAMAKAATNGSKMENFLRIELKKLGYDVIFHKQGLVANHNLEVDIFLPSKNVIIEIDGPTHFLPIFGEDKLQKVMEADNKKNGLLIAKGFTVLRFKYLAKRFGEIQKRKVIKEIEKFLSSNYKKGTIVEIEV